MTDFSLERVIWADGDFITAAHFETLEQWAVGEAAWRVAHTLPFGLARPWGETERTCNKQDCCVLGDIVAGNARHFLVRIENLRGLTPGGHALHVAGSRTFEVDARNVPGGRATLVLCPAPARPSSAGSEAEVPADRPRLRAPEYALLCQELDRDRDGLAIARVDLKGPQPSVDPVFLPPVVTIRAAEAVEVRHARINEGIASWGQAVIKYLHDLETLAGGPSAEVRRSLRDLVRRLAELRPYLADAYQTPRAFIHHVGSVARLVYTTLLLDRTSGDFDEAKLEKVLGEAKAGLIDFKFNEREMGEAFGWCERVVSWVGNCLEVLPAGAELTQTELHVEALDVMPKRGEVYTAVKVAFREELKADGAPLAVRIVFACGDPDVDLSDPKQRTVRIHPTKGYAMIDPRQHYVFERAGGPAGRYEAVFQAEQGSAFKTLQLYFPNAFVTDYEADGFRQDLAFYLMATPAKRTGMAVRSGRG